MLSFPARCLFFITWQQKFAIIGDETNFPFHGGQVFLNPDNVSFRHQWRTYQERALTDMERHLDDDNLHIVAAPGAGKTTLGWEVALRLSRPALILCPAIVIQEQWKARLLESFAAPDVDLEQYLSSDLKNPRYFTVVTYQGLHSIYRLDGVHKLVEFARDFQTIVLDECHHLRREWWKALTALTEHKRKAKIVALTATPPFDVSAAEWNRYHQLCGPIDAEISIPELVQTGDLCPHQDYVYLCLPTEERRHTLQRFHAEVDRVRQILLTDRRAQLAVAGHPFVGRPISGEAVQNPDLLRSLWRYCKTVGIYPRAMKTLDPTIWDELGEFAASDLETLLNDEFHTASKDYRYSDSQMTQLASDLKLHRISHKERVQITDNEAVFKTLRADLGKIDACTEIYRAEATSRGSKLRMVILTNHIRLDAIKEPVNKLGVLPIFRRLLRDNPDRRIAVLTGYLVVFHEEILAELHQAGPSISRTPFPGIHGYGYVRVNDAMRRQWVGLITDRFEEGHIQTIIGTTSLLGEGWDAPSLNSLILATTSTSYVQVNQLRGRAIRQNPKEPEKCATIWHLATVDPFTADGGLDVQRLRRSFDVFPGLHRSARRIESGADRLNLPTQWNPEAIEKFNQEMFIEAQQPLRCLDQWRESLAEAGAKHQGYLQERLSTRGTSVLKSLVVRTNSAWPWRTTKWTAALSVPGLLFSGVGFEYALAGGLGVTLAVFAGSGAAKQVWQQVRPDPRTLTKNNAMALAQVVLRAMRDTGQYDLKDAKCRADLISDTELVFRLAGVPVYENDLFITCIAEMLDQRLNARYVMVCEARPPVCVPSLFDKRKRDAERFAAHWQAIFSEYKLIYAKTKEGRRYLLQATLTNSLRGTTTVHRQTVWERGGGDVEAN